MSGLEKIVGYIVLLFIGAIIVIMGYLLWDQLLVTRGAYRSTEAIIEGRIYKKAHTSLISSGKVMVPIMHPEQYLVMVRLKEIPGIYTIEITSGLFKNNLINTAPVKYQEVTRFGKHVRWEVVLDETY